MLHICTNSAFNENKIDKMKKEDMSRHTKQNKMFRQRFNEFDWMFWNNSLPGLSLNLPEPFQNQMYLCIFIYSIFKICPRSAPFCKLDKRLSTSSPVKNMKVFCFIKLMFTQVQNLLVNVMPLHDARFLLTYNSIWKVGTLSNIAYTGLHCTSYV